MRWLRKRPQTYSVSFFFFFFPPFSSVTNLLSSSKRDLKGHFDSCALLKGIREQGSVYVHPGSHVRGYSQLQLEELVCLTIASATIESETSAGSIWPMVKVLDAVLPGLVSMLPDMPDRIMREWIPRLVEERMKLIRPALFRRPSSNFTFDSTGDKSSDDSQANKLRALVTTVRVQSPSPTEPAIVSAVLIALDAVPSSDGTARANFLWLYNNLVQLFCTEGGMEVTEVRGCCC